MISRCFFALLFMVCSSTVCRAKQETDTSCHVAEQRMVKELSSMRVAALYSMADTGLYINNVWKEKENRCAVISILKDREGNDRVQFMAAEILLENCTGIPGEIDRARLGELYAIAIKKNYTGDLNRWGMYDSTDIGPVGKHLLKIGKPAVPALARLLNKRGGLVYSGSKGASVANEWLYRKKDVAAFFIIHIMQYSLPWPKDPKKRDEVIKQVKAKLAE
ncbi:MAG TPA: hypothetical protein VFU15_06505 [Bacteroidia bacterium]|nr:hypothetical protein [Bacteroidia bacterium]